MGVKKGITFVIPSINRPTIHRAIDSLIRQSNPNWECVIVYDGVDGPSFNDERVRRLRLRKQAQGTMFTEWLALFAILA